MAAPSVLQSADRWLSEIFEFRKNPAAFFTTRQIEDGEFVMDILQAMYSDKLGDSIRIVLLSTLQEKSSCLMSTPDSIEQTVGSLMSMYDQTTSETAAFYKSQLLVTMTTILLESGQLEAQPKLFTDFVELLLDTVSKVNSAVDRTVRGTACQCLNEIETMHPGILMRKLEHFYAMSQLECTHVCQNYMALFVQVLKNSIYVLLRSGESIDSSEVTDLLCSRTEPLKPLTLPEDFSNKMFQLGSPKDSSVRCFSEDVDSKELLRCLSFLLDHLYLMTMPCAVTTLLKLIDCMVTAPHIAPHILRPFVTRVEATHDVTLFHALLILKHKFGRQLMTDAEEELLLDRLVSCSSHPCLTPGHRLLCYQWLLNFPENKASDLEDTKSHLPTGLDYTKTASLYPGVFDGLDTTLIKLNLLSLCFTPSHVQDSASATLIGCLVSLQKSIHYGITGRPAITLYRALYLYYRRHYETVLRSDIYKLIVTIVTEQPKFVPHTINFIECINRIDTKDSFPTELLQSSMENIVSTPPSDVLEDLEFHLLLLEKVCKEKSISPKPIVAFLRQLLTSTSIGSNGSWLLGNCILSVCHSIMQHHDTTEIFKELGQLLYELLTSYGDLDIRDRARFYYAMLTNISSQKISSILSSAGTTHSLTRLVTGSSNFDIPSPVQKLQQPVLCLTRIQRRPEYMTFACSNCQQYLQNLQSNQKPPVIHMDYYLHFTEVSSTRSVDKLYSLVLHVDIPKSYKEIPDVSLSCLTLDESQQPSDTCQVISLQIQPLEPVPSKLPVSTVFMTADGQTSTCSLSPVHIQFSDLFLPLPVSSSNRPGLFDDLWKYMQDHSKTCAESVCTLLLNKTAMLEVIQNQLQEYRIDHVDKEDDTSRIGIFLPPSWHLLLKITAKQDMTVVAIATDNWKTLPLVNTFLHELEESRAR
ncbi:AP-5 complex subunit beta-1-like isoform X2 [Patiria miniata]|uniref:AP-5 complex subunit beta-1 n=1 Tax=Patiria miniata TaxID=46514 RepID=A0A913ZQN4_PATMI|nr:AP-5 complex subunit beta-1-like isoform X2 [Patiria miniata]